MFNKKLLLAIPLVFAIPCASAGFDEGIAAYTAKNYPLALREFRPLAAKGNGDALFSLAAMYEGGHGVVKNYATAVALYRKAAAQGDASAVAQLERLRDMGIETDKPGADSRSQGDSTKFQSQGKTISPTKNLHEASVRMHQSVDSTADGGVLEGKAQGRENVRSVHQEGMQESKAKSSETAPVGPSSATEVSNSDAQERQLTFSERREKFPALAGLDDMDFIDAVHQVYYPNIERTELARLLGYIAPEPTTSWVGMGLFWILLLSGVFANHRMRRARKIQTPLVSPIVANGVGVGGWLKFFIFTLGVFGWMLSFGRAANEFYMAEITYPYLIKESSWEMYKNIKFLLLAALGGLNICVALKLKFCRNERVISFVKISIMANMVLICIIAIALERIVSVRHSGFESKPKFGELFLSISYCVILLLYFSFSKRVKATYLHNRVPLDTPTSPSSLVSNPSNLAPSDTTQKTHGEAKFRESMDNGLIIATQEIAISEFSADATPRGIERKVAGEELWELAILEFEGAGRRLGLWARLYSDANGNESIAKANYLRVRVSELMV